MTRFRALLITGVFGLAFTFAGCFGDGPDCTEITSIGAGAPSDTGGPEICPSR